MSRIHLFELADQIWFPHSLRTYMQDFLTFVNDFFGDKTYRGFGDKLGLALRTSGQDRLLELCSGSGGPGRLVVGVINASRGTPVALVLSDLYPNHRAFELCKEQMSSPVDLISEPIDATRVPPGHDGFRLICNAFHHFDVPAAKRVIADAVDKRQGIAVVETLRRSPRGFASIFLAIVLQLLATPFIRPFSLGRLVFTYAIPAMPLALLWDGIVSCARIYSPEELKRLTDGLNGYDFDIGEVSAGGPIGYTTYLIGTPR